MKKIIGLLVLFLSIVEAQPRDQPTDREQVMIDRVLAQAVFMNKAEAEFRESVMAARDAGLRVDIELDDAPPAQDGGAEYSIHRWCQYWPDPRKSSRDCKPVTRPFVWIVRIARQTPPKQPETVLYEIQLGPSGLPLGAE